MGRHAGLSHGNLEGRGRRRISHQRGQAISATTGSHGSAATTTSTRPLPSSMRRFTELRNVRPICVEKAGLIGGL